VLRNQEKFGVLYGRGYGEDGCAAESVDMWYKTLTMRQRRMQRELWPIYDRRLVCTEYTHGSLDLALITSS
jgi:hypothetical protein